MVEGVGGFQALRSDWNALFERAAKPHQLFQSHGFLSAWVDSYGDGKTDIVVITARAGDRLVAIAPLLRQKRLGFVRLRLMGAPVAQFDDMLLDADFGTAALPGLWAQIEALRADLLEVRRMRADSAFWQFGSQNSRCFEMMEAPFALLEQRVDGDTPGEAYSAKERSSYRRRVRRLAERGSLALEVHRPGPEAQKLAAQAVEMKRRSLRRAGILSSAVRSHRFAKFFDWIAADPDSGLLVSSIELSGRPIGIDLSFLCKGSCFGHVLATDSDFDKEGVGNVLVHHVFSGARKAGAGTFDLLAPADAYKLRHADGQTLVESRIYPFTQRGRLASRAVYGLALPLARWGSRKLAAILSRRGGKTAQTADKEE